ncbi:sulfotransferase [Candidatus Daviesbacteria bacterium]|nr:sulfotransferase [Candidatus Daviesbacteria bacterium]
MRIPKNISVVAVQNYGSSGTLFLHSLFDNHPKVLMTPALYSRSFFAFWESYGKRYSRSEELINAFTDYHKYWFTKKGAPESHGLNQLGPRMNQSVCIKEKHFSGLLKNLLGKIYPSRKNFFIATYLSYAYALGRKIHQPKVIFFPIHSLPKKHAQYLLSDFPKAKFLHMVRAPIPSINSGIKHILFNNLPVNTLECTVSQMLCDYMQLWGKKEERYVYGFRPFFSSYTKFSKAVRLEDLHQKNKETLRAICKWLNLPWDNHLLESTFDGKKWWNRPESPRISGIGIQTIDRKISYLNSFDQFRLLCLAYPKYKHWEYKISNMYRNKLLKLFVFLTLALPFKTEFSLLKERLVFFTQKQIKLSQKKVMFIIRSIDSSLATQVISVYQKYPVAIKILLAIFIIIFTPILVIVFLILIIRDYFAIRFWAYKAWFDLYNKKQVMVKLLPIN